MKVARYEVPGSHEKQVPSRRERYDWSSLRWRPPLKPGFSSGPRILASPNRKSRKRNPSHRTLRDGSPTATFPGTSYLATFVLSLRDQSASICVHLRLVRIASRFVFIPRPSYNFQKIPCQNRSVRLITVTGHVLPL